jgi:anaerobic magnesium-protoporphyrin IX monomethyl ester cyclase
VLINPPLSKDSHQIHRIYLPIGLPYLAAVLEKNGYDVEVVDCEALDIDFKSLGSKLASLKPKVVGITSTTPTIQAALLSF